MKALLILLAFTIASGAAISQDRAPSMVAQPAAPADGGASAVDVALILRGAGLAADYKRVVRQSIEAGEDDTLTSRRIVALDDGTFERLLAEVLAPRMDAQMVGRMVAFHASEAGKALLRDFQGDAAAGGKGEVPEQYLDEIIGYLGGPDAEQLRVLLADPSLWSAFADAVNDKASAAP